MEEARARFERFILEEYVPLQTSAEAMPVEAKRTIPVGGGEVEVTIYSHGDNRTKPAHLHIHGGGFWLGHSRLDADFCRVLARGAGCVVVAVDYRRPPEHPWPTPPDDCWRALIWMRDSAAELGIDPNQISVGGSSAGACLAAGVAIRARDEHIPIHRQILDVPVTDLCNVEPLVTTDGHVIDGGKRDYVATYVSGVHAAEASPLHATTLAGVAPALIIVAEYDQLRPDGVAYANRLAQSRVPVQVVTLTGQFHGSGRLAKLIPEQAADLDANIIKSLKSNLPT